MPNTLTSASNLARGRNAAIHLRRLVQRASGERLENMGAATADVHFVEPALSGYVLALSAREVVNDDDLVAAGEEAFGHVRADKPGAPGKQDPHLRRPRQCSLVRSGEPLRVLSGPREPGCAAPSLAPPWRGLCPGQRRLGSSSGRGS